MDTLGDFCLVTTGRSNFSGFYGVDRNKCCQQTLRAGVRPVFLAWAAGKVTQTGVEQLLEARRAAQGISLLEQSNDGGRT